MFLSRLQKVVHAICLTSIRLNFLPREQAVSEKLRLLLDPCIEIRTTAAGEHTDAGPCYPDKSRK